MSSQFLFQVNFIHNFITKTVKKKAINGKIITGQWVSLYIAGGFYIQSAQTLIKKIIDQKCPDCYITDASWAKDTPYKILSF